MAEATYTLTVDLNRDGDFSDADEDLSARLIEAHWFNGFQSPYDAMCRDSFADFVLDNYDGKYSPEKAGAIVGLDKGKVVTFDMTFGSTVRMFTGWVDKVSPVPDRWGPRTAKLYCDSWVTKAGRTKRWLVPVQRNKRVDEIIPELIDRTGCYPPGLSGAIWLLDIDGYSELDVTTYLSDATSYLTAETGGVTVALVGTKWNEQTSLFNAMAEVVKREGLGRLWLGRDGLLNFWNRDHMMLTTTIDQTYDDSYPPAGLAYDYAALLFNRVSVKYSNQQIGSAPEVLGIYSNEIVLAAGETKSVSYGFADSASGARVGGQDVLAPVITTDFSAWTASGGGGSSVTSGLATGIRREGGGNAEVEFINSNAFTVYIQTGSQVRGTKVVAGSDATRTAEDVSSIAAQGFLEFTFPNTVEGDDYAQSLADFWLGLGKDPRGYARSLTIEARASSAYMTDALNLTVGAMVSLTEVQTGLSAGLYFIISEEHWVTTRPYRHKVTYKLEPASSQQVWLFDVTGFAELDTTAILAPW